MSEENAVKRRSLVSELLELLTDNPLLTTEQCANVLGCNQKTIAITRASDSFRALLALRIDRLHGDAIRAVRNNTLLAANEALDTARRIMADAATVGSLKLEAAKLVLENHDRSEERLIPKGGTAYQPGTNVTVNLTFDELHAARESSLAHGATLELEASDKTHVPPVPFERARLFAPSHQGGFDLRKESVSGD